MHSICCLHCNHPLAPGGAHACPECGARFDPGDPATVGRLRNGRRVRERSFRPVAFLLGPIIVGSGAPAMMLVLSVGGYGLAPVAIIVFGALLLAGTVFAVRQGIWFAAANARTYGRHAALFALWMVGSVVLAMFAFALLGSIPIPLP